MPERPAASRATAVSVCGPLPAVVVFHETEYGAVVSSLPRFAPSSLNWTPATPTSSAAVALTVIVPDTVAPRPAPVSVAVGAVVSGGGGAPPPIPVSRSAATSPALSARP